MNPNGVKLFALEDVQGVYADAFVTDPAESLLFASLWGRDTSIQELLARLSLPSTEGGLYRLSLVDQDNPDRKHALVIGNADRLAKLSGRMPKANLFGDVAQVWLYDRQATEPDYGARRALRLFRCEDGDPAQAALQSDLTWSLIKDVCHLPLLDAWRDLLVPLAAERGWVSCQAGVGVHALRLHLDPEALEAAIETLIRSGRLTVTGPTFTARVAEPGAHDDQVSGSPGSEKSDAPLTAAQLAHQLDEFTGTTVWYRHALVRTMTYTEGVQCFAEYGGDQGAYWFLDVVATEFYPLLAATPFLHIVLSVEDGKAMIRVDDGNGRLLREKAIEYTDLQPGDWRFYLTDDVLLLPSEY